MSLLTSLLAPGNGTSRPELEGANFTAYGHSYINPGNGNNYSSPSGKWADRVASRLRTATLSNQGQSGYWAQDVFARVGGTDGGAWTIGGKGLVALDLTQNDMQANGADAQGLRGFKNALTSILHVLRAASAVQQTDASFVDTTGTWATDTKSWHFGGTTKYTSSNPAVQTISFTGDECVVFLRGWVSAAPVSVDVAVDGGAATTYSLAAQCQESTSSLVSNSVPFPIHLTGMGAGAHSITVTRNTTVGGSAVIQVDGLVVPSSTPPLVGVQRQMYLPSYVNNGSDAAVDAYNAAIDEVAALFDEMVVVVDASLGWDTGTMLNNRHPNDRGAAHLASAFVSQVGAVASDYILGLNYGV